MWRQIRGIWVCVACSLMGFLAFPLAAAETGPRSSMRPGLALSVAGSPASGWTALAPCGEASVCVEEDDDDPFAAPVPHSLTPSPASVPLGRTRLASAPARTADQRSGRGPPQL